MLKAAGTVEEYEAKADSVKVRLRQQLQCFSPACALTVTAEAGSVILTVVATDLDTSGGASQVGSAAVGLQTQPLDVMSRLLGVTIEAVPAAPSVVELQGWPAAAAALMSAAPLLPLLPPLLPLLLLAAWAVRRYCRAPASPAPPAPPASPPKTPAAARYPPNVTPDVRAPSQGPSQGGAFQVQARQERAAAPAPPPWLGLGSG